MATAGGGQRGTSDPLELPCRSSKHPNHGDLSPAPQPQFALWGWDKHHEQKQLGERSLSACMGPKSSPPPREAVAGTVAEVEAEAMEECCWCAYLGDSACLLLRPGTASLGEHHLQWAGPSDPNH